MERNSQNKRAKKIVGRYERIKDRKQKTGYHS
jgi:hypothetical protein